MNDQMIQALLNIAGYKIFIDGKVGPKTRAIVELFQDEHGLVVDGNPGPATQYELMFYKYPHFKKEEFRCFCKGKYCNGYPVKVDENLIRVLEEIRAVWGKSIHINSGIRCKEWNKRVGGIPNSQHLLGKAADIVVAGAKPSEVQKVAYQLNRIGGTGFYPTFTHVDTKGYRFRFNG